jgi:hemerythrin superfamily protein
MADAITLLRDDHRTVEKLFKSFEKAGENAAVTKKRLVKSMIEELSVHAAIEEQVFYPAVRAEVSGTNDEVLEALEEHHIVKWELSELDGLDPADERFGAKVTVLIENVRHHVREEEGQLFPAVRAALGRTRLAELGADLEAIRRVAPTKPHPRSPQEPPANLVVGAVAGMVDQATETVKRVARRA